MGLWVACLVVLVLRRPDLLAHPQFLAEDGVVFFREQLMDGATSIWHQYAGYHHLAARIVALAAAGLPVVAQPAFYAGAVLFLEAASCAAVGVLLKSVAPNPWVRGIVAIGIAAAIPADEIIGSVANLQWYLALPVLTASIVPPPARLIWPVRVAGVLVGLSTPQGVFAAPFALWRWVRRGHDGDPWIPTLYAGASICNVVTATDAAGRHATPDWPLAALVSTWYRVGDALWFGRSGAETLAAHSSIGGALIGAATIAAVLALVARMLGMRAVFAVAFVLFAPIAVTLNARELGGASILHYEFFGGDRYFVTACAALLVAALVASSRLSGRARVAALIVVSLLPIVNDFREPQPLENDDWPTSAVRVEGWRAQYAARSATAPISVPIPPAWKLDLPACRPGAGGAMTCE